MSTTAKSVDSAQRLRGAIVFSRARFFFFPPRQERHEGAKNVRTFILSEDSPSLDQMFPKKQHNSVSLIRYYNNSLPVLEKRSHPLCETNDIYGTPLWA